MERTADAAPRKISQAEKESTKAQVCEKLFPGLKMEKARWLHRGPFCPDV